MMQRKTLDFDMFAIQEKAIVFMKFNRPDAKRYFYFVPQFFRFLPLWLWFLVLAGFAKM